MSDVASDIPRFTIIDGQEYPDPEGQWVFVNDALAAVAAATVPTGVWEEDSFDAGVKAAREAVADLARPDDAPTYYQGLLDAVAAIDDLKGEQA